MYQTKLCKYFQIDFMYVRPNHIPLVNQLAREFFWPGIDRKFSTKALKNSDICFEIRFMDVSDLKSNPS